MPVSREAVKWGYRLLLGRDPESEQVILLHSRAKSEADLAENLMRSPEFAASRRLRPALRFVDPWEAEPLAVETAATPAQLAACLAKIAAAWKQLGSTQPYFSVLTDRRFLPTTIGGHIERFWASGEVEAEQAVRVLERHGLSSLTGKNCVEYGCGVGRVTSALARRFARVDAYDISPSHLEYAKRRAAELELGNVGFHECPANMPAELEPCDVFYSRIVFQHNPPPIILELIRRALRALKRGGIAIFQVPVYIKDYRFKLVEWLGAEHPLDMQMHCLPQEHIFGLMAGEGCVPLEILEDKNVPRTDKMISNMCVVRRP